MTFDLGKRVGAYEILAPLGAGGMGEVLRARDTKLGRDVAIKVLPEEFLRDVERLARFQREARLLAQLNHLNVATLHGLEEIDGRQFLVMELVEGETLAERIAGRPMPIGEAIPLFTQIAEGLEAAHEKGIIHRDLKPSNIKIGADGKAKILDFGLAKALAREGVMQDLSQSPTLTRNASETGVLLGTAAYMSPEQARGKPADKRTDIWAFGCCFYEALTGKVAFLGETVSDTLAAILEHEPSWDRLPRSTPSSLRRLLRRCLQKDLSKRFHDIGDARIEIEEALTELDSEPEASRADRRSVPLPLAALGALMAAAIAVVAMWSSVGPLERVEPPRRYPIPLYPDTAITDFSNASIAVSRDGSRIAYAAVDREGTKRLYVREMDQFESTPVPGTEGDPRGLFFAPDGKRIGYYDSGRLKQVSLSGGRPAVICDARGAYRGGSWGDDDTIVMSSYSLGLLRGSATSSRCEIIAQPNGKDEKTYYYPQILPGGEWVLYTVGTFEMESYEDARISVLSLETGERRKLLEGGTHARYLPSGHLVYVSGGALVAAPFDVDRMEVLAPGVTVVEGVMTYPAFGAAQFTCSDDGLFAYVSGVPLGKRELVWVDRTGSAQSLPLGPRMFDTIDISPNGDRVAIEIEGGNAHIWIYDLGRENLARLTFVGNNEDPIWTPNGREVVYNQFKDGDYKGMRKTADGMGDETEFDATDPWSGSWLPDESVFAYESGWNIWMLSLNDRVPKLFLGTRFREKFPRFSPDGRSLAYTSDESGQDEVYLTSYPDGGHKVKVSQNGGTRPVWNPKGGELFYREGGALVSVAIATGPSLRLGEAKRLFEGDYLPSYDVRPDGEEFLMIRSVDEPPPAHINVVSNWFSELKRLVPANK